MYPRKMQSEQGPVAFASVANSIWNYPLCACVCEWRLPICSRNVLKFPVNVMLCRVDYFFLVKCVLATCQGLQPLRLICNGSLQVGYNTIQIAHFPLTHPFIMILLSCISFSIFSYTVNSISFNRMVIASHKTKKKNKCSSIMKHQLFSNAPFFHFKRTIWILMKF